MGGGNCQSMTCDFSSSYFSDFPYFPYFLTLKVQRFKSPNNWFLLLLRSLVEPSTFFLFFDPQVVVGYLSKSRLSKFVQYECKMVTDLLRCLTTNI